MYDHVSLPRTHITLALSLVPAETRTAVLEALLLGSDAHPTSPSDEGAIDLSESEAISYPLTIKQWRDLKGKLDVKTFAVMKSIAEDVTDGLGRIAWTKVKEITGVPNWTTFAKGRLGGLHRALRGVDGVEGKAVLLWWNNEEWQDDGEGDWSTGFLYIDGQALQSLRSMAGAGDA